MVLGLSADLITKEVVFQKCYLPGEVPEKYWLIDGVFGIETSTNGGALFGMGQGKHQWFAALSVLAITALCTWLFVFKAARDRFLTICLGVISGGILGNLFDRVGLGFREGYLEETRYHVRDWIHFRIEGVPYFDPWPNFNIADCLLVCGAGVLFIHALFFAKPQKPASSADNKTDHANETGNAKEAGDAKKAGDANETGQSKTVGESDVSN